MVEKIISPIEQYKYRRITERQVEGKAGRQIETVHK